jgi:protein ImuB
VRRLGAHGLQARAAIADTVGCAWGVARFPPGSLHSPPSPFRGGISIASGDERTTLSPLPLAALRLAPDVIEALVQVGLKRVADVLDRPRAPLAARFNNLMRRLDQALGLADEPITPRLPIPIALVEQRFNDPIALERDVLGTIGRLAARLAPVLEQRGEGARLLQVALFRTDGKVFRIEVGTGEPLREPARIARLFAERLGVINDEIDPGFGFDVVRLCALVTERSDPHQTGLAAPDHAAELAHLIDRLGARFGLRRVTRLIEQDTHVPEYAMMAVGAHMVQSSTAAYPGRNAGRSLAPRTGHAELDSLAPARPIRLFTRPEPVEAMAEVPDGPPVRFRWRRMPHEVAYVEGPERIAMEWWRDETGRALTRDYFRVESREGVRVWIYREGLFVAGGTTRWFVHGVFA